MVLQLLPVCVMYSIVVKRARHRCTCDVCDRRGQEELLVDVFHQGGDHVCCVVQLLLHCSTELVLRQRTVIHHRQGMGCCALQVSVLSQEGGLHSGSPSALKDASSAFLFRAEERALWLLCLLA